MIQSTGMTEGVDTSSLSKAMSQIGLKDTELVKLRQQVEDVERKELKRNKVENRPKKSIES